MCSLSSNLSFTLAAFICLDCHLCLLNLGILQALHSFPLHVPWPRYSLKLVIKGMSLALLIFFHISEFTALHSCLSSVLKTIISNTLLIFYCLKIMIWMKRSQCFSPHQLTNILGGDGGAKIQIGWEKYFSYVYSIDRKYNKTITNSYWICILAPEVWRS